MSGSPVEPQLETEATDPEAVREKVIDGLRTVFDPEIPVDVYELGLIYGVTVAEGGATHIRMTLTAPTCPVAEELPAEIEFKTRAIAGVTSVQLDIVWDPPWTPDRMTDAARLTLGML